MNTLHDVFARRAMEAGSPDMDVHALVGLGEKRVGRRRLTVALASGTAVVAVIALALSLTLNDTVTRDQGPVETPSMREIVYSDVEQGVHGLSGDTVHFGDRVVETGRGFLHMDVTDDGFVYLTNEGRRLWFSDGSAPEQIGSGVCRDSAGFVGVQVKTSNQGSLVAWFDCSERAHPALVVFDTSLGREVVRRPVTRCGVEASFSGWCHPEAIIGEHIYFTRIYFRHGGDGRVATSALELDIATGRVTAAHSYLDDVRSHRGLVIGDSWETGTPTTGIGESFSVVGTRLVPEISSPGGPAPVPTSAFDTATRRAVVLHLPPEYHGADEFDLFEWLDDDTVALAGPTGWDDTPGYGDILTCQLSDGRCELTVRGHGPVRVVANGGLPG